MQTCVMNHGPCNECYGPVVYGGGEANCRTHEIYSSRQVNEPAERAQLVCAAPNFESIPQQDPSDLMYSSDEDEYGDESIVLSRRFSHVFKKTEGNSWKEFAGVAAVELPTNKNYDLSKEKGLLTVDNGSTATLTKSLFNMTDVKQKVIDVQLAGEGMSIKASHVGRKTYYAVDVTGSIRPITTKAYYVPDLEQDLLSGRSLIKAKFRITMDADESISGIFPVVDGEIDPATRFPFADSKGLFYIETVPISETKYKTMSGYDLWHKRLSHVPRQAIKDTIPHSKGLQDLEGLRMNREMDCGSCMVGKATLQPYPKSKPHAKRPLERVYIDIMSSSTTSIEGFDHALVVTDDASMYRWAYGLKTKDEANAAVRKWISDIVDIRDRHPLEVIIRDNAGELRSKDINDHIVSLGFKNYFSVAYEQWQNGLSESSIKSLGLLVRPQMAESGMAGRFWFRALISARDGRNVTYHERIKTTPHKMIFGESKNVSRFRAFGCRAYMFLNEERRGPGKLAPRALEGINLGFASDSNTSGYVIWIPAKRKTYITNQVRFDETVYPYRKHDVIDKNNADNALDILDKQDGKI